MKRTILSIVCTVIATMMAFADEVTQRSVVVETPGTLAELIGEDNLLLVEELTVSGTLNGKDVQALRLMAGRTADHSISGGVLSVLDMSAVEFTNSYEAEDYYQVSQYVIYRVEEGTISSQMFYECNSLKEVVIPVKTKKIDSEAFRNCKYLNEVVLPEGLESIGSRAFYDDKNIRSFTIPASVEKIEYGAFYGCDKLMDLNITEGSKLQIIESSAFNSSGITSIKIPAEVERIEGSTFSSCRKLSSVEFEEGTKLSFIGSNAFSSCSNLSEFTLPDGVTDIEQYAFAWGNNLKYFNISEDSKLENIGDRVFENSGIQYIYIPKKLISVGNWGITPYNLESVTVHPENRYIKNIGGIVYATFDGTILFVPKTISGTISIDESIYTLPSYIFRNNNKIETLILPSKLAEVSDYAFDGCSGLKRIIAKCKSVPYLNNDALWGVDPSNITLMVLPSLIEKYQKTDWSRFKEIIAIGEDPIIEISDESITLYNTDDQEMSQKHLRVSVIALDDLETTISWQSADENVATVTADGVVSYVGAGTTVVTATIAHGDSQFTLECQVRCVSAADNELMVVVKEPGTLSSLLTEDQKENTQSLVVLGSLNSDDLRVLRYMTGRNHLGTISAGILENLDMSGANIVYGGEGYYKPDTWWYTTSSDEIPQSLFYGCASLKHVVLPSTVTNISYSAFYDCSSLESIVIPDGVTRISNNAFTRCESLKEIVLPASVVSLESSAFYGCKALERVDMSACNNLTEINSSVFSQCNLTSVVLPEENNISVIRNDAFNGNGNLQSFDLSNFPKLESLGSNAFSGTAIEVLNIPRSLLDLDNARLHEMRSLKEINVHELNKVYMSYDGVLYRKVNNNDETSLISVPAGKEGTLMLHDALTDLPSNMLVYDSRITTVIIPKKVETIGAYCFSNNVKDVICFRTECPTVAENTFNNMNLTDATLYVGKDAKEKYETDTQWGRFGTVKALSSEPEVTISKETVELYRTANIPNPSYQLSAKVLTESGLITTGLVWTSSNTEVAQVSENGLVTMGSESGTADITVTYTSGEKTATAKSIVTTLDLSNDPNAYYVEAGKLSELITSDKKYEITKLTLYGSINNNDVSLLRDMAGRCNNVDTKGKLEYLDLSHVVVAEGGNSIITDCSGWTHNYNGNFGDGAFAELKTLKTIILPNTLTEVSYNLLRDCMNLESVTISSATTYIRNYAFMNNNSLATIIVLAENAPEREYWAFDGVNTSDILVIVPVGSKSKYTQSWYIFDNIMEMSDEPVVILNNSSIIVSNLNNGANASKQLSARVFDATGYIPSPAITWASSNSEVAAVDANGLVTIGAQGGNAVITATYAQNGKTYIAECAVEAIYYENTENVYLVEAGNLGQLIPEEERANIKKITLVGELNGDDIRILREMAGSPYYCWNSSGSGNLANIDMSNARIVAGGSSYCYVQWQDENGNGVGQDPQTENDVFGKGFFYNAEALKEIKLPKGIKKIDTYAFYGCVGLPEEFEVPANVKVLGQSALNGFSRVYVRSLTPITMSGNMLVGNEGMIIVPTEAYETYITADGWKEFADKIIPDNIQLKRTVDVQAEANGSGLQSALGDDGMKYTQDLTIRGTINGYDIMVMRNKMPMLSRIDMTDAQIVANPYEYYTGYNTEDHRLGSYTFYNMNRLTEVILPKDITYVGYSAMAGCSALRHVKMYPGVTTIDSGAFSSCGSLTNIELPEGLLSIGGSAFSSCRMQEINIPSTVMSIGGGCFNNCSSLRNVILPVSLRKIEWSTFSGCYALESVTIPARVSDIENYAFSSCNNLKEVRIPPMVEHIGDGAFSGCNNLKSIYVYIANANDIKIDMNTFSCWTTATLYIPTFGRNSYYWDTQWSQFYKLEEFSEDYETFYTKSTMTLDGNSGGVDGTPDATIYEGGAIVINDDVEQDIDNLEMHSDADGGGASIIPESNENLNIAALDIIINVSANQWHFFCFPFDIDLSTAEYEGEYAWRQYDGAARSRHEGGWQELSDNTLHAYRGYIFQGTNSGELKLHVDNPTISAEDHQTDLEDAASDNPADASWNFIGNPYSSYYDITDADYDQPITIWTGNGYEAYRPGDDDYHFAPYQAFFVQKPADSDGIGFDADGRETNEEAEAKSEEAQSKPRLVARQQATAAKKRSLINLELREAEALEGKYMDKTRVVFNEKASMSYEISCDASKFFSDMRSAEFFTMDHDGVNYSINERPVGSGEVAMGFRCLKAGQYVINAQRMDSKVYLLDRNTGLTYDFENGGYEFSSEVGTFLDRFVIISDPSVTAIVGVEINKDADNASDNIYSISGVRITRPIKGEVYITNGEKKINK